MRPSDLLRPLVFGLGVAAPLLPIALYFHGNWYSFFHPYSLGMAFGLAAAAYYLNCLVLSSRLPFLDRLFGHDRVLVFHGWTAVAALFLTLAHVFFKVLYGLSPTLQIALGMAASALFDTVIVVTLTLMVNGRVARLPPVRRLRDRLRIDYSRLKAFHNLTAAAAALMAVHVLLASATREKTLRTTVMAVWAATALLLWIGHKVLRPLLLRLTAFRVATVKAVTADVVALTLDRPVPLARNAGQFVYIRPLSDPPGVEEHPFTVSSPPESALELTVKDLGDWTGRLGRIPPGSKVLVDGPYGRFTPSPTEAPHLFLAAGIGITPFLAVLSAWEREGSTPSAPVRLLWSLKSSKDLFSRDLLERLDRRGWFSWRVVFTREGGGRIGPGELATALPGPPASVTCWICGPDGFRRDMEKALRGLGVRRIRYERFSF